MAVSLHPFTPLVRRAGILLALLTFCGVAAQAEDKAPAGAEKAPMPSVVVAAIDSDFVYIHDPDIKTERGESDTDKAHVPIDRAAFTRMARFGQSSTRATVLLSPRRKRRGG